MSIIGYMLSLGISLMGLLLFDLVIRLAAFAAIPLYPRFTYEAALPHFIASFANFDGVHYLTIAEHGYSGNNYAFFPLYPLLTHLVSIVVHHHFIAAMMITLFSCAGGLILYKKYARLMLGHKHSEVFALLLLLFFPTSFFLTSVYTEPLFLLSLVSFFYFMAAKNPRLAAVSGFFASLTRFIGVFLIVPVIVLIILDRRNYKKYLPALIAPALGLGMYALYLWFTTGDPLKFFHVQPSFGANRSTQIVILPQVYYRYIKIFLQSAINFQYWIAVLEFGITSLFLGILALDLRKIWMDKKFPHRAHRLALNAFSWINIIVPTLTGTFLSVPRFSLMSLSVFFFFAEIQSPWVKGLLLAVFGLLHIILLAYFTQGYFVS